MTLEIFEATPGRWRWRLRNSYSAITCDCSHTRRRGAINAAQRFIAALRRSDPVVAVVAPPPPEQGHSVPSAPTLGMLAASLLPLGAIPPGGRLLKK